MEASSRGEIEGVGCERRPKPAATAQNKASKPLWRC